MVRGRSRLIVSTTMRLLDELGVAPKRSEKAYTQEKELEK